MLALGLEKWIPTVWVDLVRETDWWWVSTFSADVLMLMADAATPCPWKMLAILGLQNQKYSLHEILPQITGLHLSSCLPISMNSPYFVCFIPRPPCT